MQNAQILSCKLSVPAGSRLNRRRCQVQTIPARGLGWKEHVYSSVPEIHVSEGLGGEFLGLSRFF